MSVDNHFPDQISAYIRERERESSDYGEYNYFNGGMFKQNNQCRENGRKKSILNLLCRCQVYED